jgi:hypothetical protein
MQSKTLLKGLQRINECHLASLLGHLVIFFPWGELLWLLARFMLL